MNLEEFISLALTEIVMGVANARENVAKHGALVGSDKVYGPATVAKLFCDEHGRTVSFVEFDIALSKGSSEDTKGGIGVFLGSIGLGVQGVSRGEETAHSRIKFTVPLVLPGAIDQ